MEILPYNKRVRLHCLSGVFCHGIIKFINEHGGKASTTSEHYSAQRRSASSCTLSVLQMNIATHATKTHLPASHIDSDQLTSQPSSHLMRLQARAGDNDIANRKTRMTVGVKGAFNFRHRASSI